LDWVGPDLYFTTIWLKGETGLFWEKGPKNLLLKSRVCESPLFGKGGFLPSWVNLLKSLLKICVGVSPFKSVNINRLFRQAKKEVPHLLLEGESQSQGEKRLLWGGGRSRI